MTNMELAELISLRIGNVPNYEDNSLMDACYTLYVELGGKESKDDFDSVYALVKAIKNENTIILKQGEVYTEDSKIKLQEKMDKGLIREIVFILDYKGYEGIVVPASQIIDEYVESNFTVDGISLNASFNSENEVGDDIVFTVIENEYVTKEELEEELEDYATLTDLDGKQDVLIAGENITISGNTISAIVPEVDAYTKSETDALLADKQDTLTAGEGITIDENNVISATGGGGKTKFYFYDTNNPEIVVPSTYNQDVLDLWSILNNDTSAIENYEFYFVMNEYGKNYEYQIEGSIWDDYRKSFSFGGVLGGDNLNGDGNNWRFLNLSIYNNSSAPVRYHLNSQEFYVRNNAPQDNKTYGIKNGSWSEIEEEGVIYLKSYDPDFNNTQYKNVYEVLKNGKFSLFYDLDIGLPLNIMKNESHNRLFLCGFGGNNYFIKKTIIINETNETVQYRNFEEIAFINGNNNGVAINIDYTEKNRTPLYDDKFVYGKNSDFGSSNTKPEFIAKNIWKIDLTGAKFNWWYGEDGKVATITRNSDGANCVLILMGDGFNCLRLKNDRLQNTELYLKGPDFKTPLQDSFRKINWGWSNRDNNSNVYFAIGSELGGTYDADTDSWSGTVYLATSIDDLSDYTITFNDSLVSSTALTSGISYNLESVDCLISTTSVNRCPSVIPVNLGVAGVWRGTQAEYDAIPSDLIDSNVLYLIKE